MVELYIFGGFAAILAAVAARSAISVLWRKLFRPKVKGHLGESRVARVLKKFTRKGAKSKNDILINHGRGTSQIDHLLITKQGIFVLETKNYSGVVRGSMDSRLWTQSFPGSYTEPRQFYNPIRQNEGHIHALRGILKEYKDVPIHSLVVFSGDCSFPNLPGVISSSALKNALRILTSGGPILSDEQVKSIEAIIDQNAILGKSARAEHNYQAGLSAEAAPGEIRELIQQSKENAVYVSIGPKVQEDKELTPNQVKRQLLTDTHAMLTIRGQTDSIDGFFEKAKRRDDGLPAPVGGNFDYFVCPFTGDNFPASEASGFYQGLWITYLNQHPDLVQFMKEVGAENLGNSFRCKKALALYSSDKDGFAAQVRSTPWYRNMVSKQKAKAAKGQNNTPKKKPALDSKVHDAASRTEKQGSANDTKTKQYQAAR